MLVAVALLIAGAAILYLGAEAAVRGATALARAVGVPAFVMGALLFGVDLEGLGAAVVAAGRGETAIAAGEIFGTVLFLYSAAFGAALLLARGPVPAPDRVMVLAPALHLVAGAFAISDRYVARLEGVLLIVFYLAYVGLVVRRGREPRAEGEETGSRGRPGRARLLAVTIGGLLTVAGGAAILVAGGARLVTEAGLAAGFVGATALGILVSLDEVILEVLPVRRGSPDLATGNLFGTLAAFTTGVLGVAALVRPLEIDAVGAVAFLGVAFLYAVVATAFLARGRAGRLLGAFVLASYAAWLVAAAAI
ncbi:MAG: sodium:calcium antiporter [Actinomycetota bacterium]